MTELEQPGADWSGEPWGHVAEKPSLIDTELGGPAEVAGESVDRALEPVRPHGPEHVWRPGRPCMLPG
jgi:hypothetical protein